MINEITPELLREFKDRMKLSDDEDVNLLRILKASIEDLVYKCGPYDVHTNEVFKELVFDRSRYVYNDALEYFDINFRSQINRLALSSANESGGPGEKGDPGKSAYELALENGFVGTVDQWLRSLKGNDGLSGANGKDGLNGADGLTAYQIAVKNGYVGSEAEWLLSLKGDPGSDANIGVHETSDAPHRYGNKFEWRYNSVTNSLDLVVLNQ